MLTIHDNNLVQLNQIFELIIELFGIYTSLNRYLFNFDIACFHHFIIGFKIPNRVVRIS